MGSKRANGDEDDDRGRVPRYVAAAAAAATGDGGQNDTNINIFYCENSKFEEKSKQNRFSVLVSFVK